MPLLKDNKLELPSFLRTIVDTVCGIAADFWKDGRGASKATKSGNPAAVKEKQARPRGNAEPKVFKWQASGRPQVLETMWGLGHCLPGGDILIGTIVAPVKFNEDKNLLDLSANMGAVGRHLADRFDAYVTGLESDAELAAYGENLSAQAGKATQAPVEAYDPEQFVASKQYSCIIARELFYRISDKGRFFKEINKSLKPKDPRGQMVFTDYVLSEDKASSPAVLAWLDFEKKAKPMSLEGITKLFSDNHIDVRVSEDMTDLYMNEILKALNRFAQFLQKYPPDKAAKAMMLPEMELWSLRIAAMKSGLRFYRFYAIKN